MSVIVLGKSRSSGRMRVTPASMEPDHRSTIRSMTISKGSPSRSGRLETTIASLNSPSALGRDAVMPLLPMRALRPCRWWKRSSSVLSSRIWVAIQQN